MATHRRTFVQGLAGITGASVAPALAGCSGLGRGDSEDDTETVGPDLPETEATLGFVGDVMLGRNVDERWSAEHDDERDLEPGAIWGSLEGRLSVLDGLVCNLECVLAEGGTRRPGRGYYFRADPDWALAALQAAGAKAVSLANNHVLDFGQQALSATRAHLESAGIAHAGAGPSLRAAIDPVRFEAGDLDVALVAFTDQSPSYGAGLASPGPPSRRSDRATR